MLVKGGPSGPPPWSCTRSHAGVSNIGWPLYHHLHHMPPTCLCTNQCFVRPIHYYLRYPLCHVPISVLRCCVQLDLSIITCSFHPIQLTHVVTPCWCVTQPYLPIMTWAPTHPTPSITIAATTPNCLFTNPFSVTPKLTSPLLLAPSPPYMSVY